MRAALLLLALLLSACTRPLVQVTTLAEGRDYRTRPAPLVPVKCQQRVALPRLK
jgi:hypothetical protein